MLITMLTTCEDLCRKTKHKASILVHTDKCKFYTENIAPSYSSKELHQVVCAHSNRHPPKYFQRFTLVLTFALFSSDSLATKYKTLELTFKQNILSKHQHLPLRQPQHLFYHLKTCHNQQSKNVFLILLLSPVSLIHSLPNCEKNV